MRTLLLCCLALPGLTLIARGEDKTDGDTRVFELRTYYASPGKLDALHARFRDHTCKLFEKHGMKKSATGCPTALKTASRGWCTSSPTRAATRPKRAGKPSPPIPNGKP